MLTGKKGSPTFPWNKRRKEKTFMHSGLSFKFQNFLWWILELYGNRFVRECTGMPIKATVIALWDTTYSRSIYPVKEMMLSFITS